MNSSIFKMGQSVNNSIAAVGYAALIQTFMMLFTGYRAGQAVRLRHVSAEIMVAGVQALPVVILMAATIGIMLSIQASIR